jgi:hypothetical protein
MNINFLVLSYFVSLFVDWIFQWDWQAVDKSKWGKKDDKLLSFEAVFTHSMVYSLLTITIIALLLNGFSHVYLVFFILLLSHMIIDTRIPVKLIMRFKGMSWEQINDYQTFGFLHIGIDQRLHELILVILSFIV